MTTLSQYMKGWKSGFAFLPDLQRACAAHRRLGTVPGDARRLCRGPGRLRGTLPTRQAPKCLPGEP